MATGRCSNDWSSSNKNIYADGSPPDKDGYVGRWIVYGIVSILIDRKWLQMWTIALVVVAAAACFEVIWYLHKEKNER